MKKLWFIGLLLLWKLSFSQDSCKPVYNLPVKFAKINDVNLAYVEVGKGDPIIFIHGLGGNSSHWLKVFQHLSKSYKCIAIDLPGYGYSDLNFASGEKDLLGFYSKKLIQFIAQKKINKPVLVGHSMGGQIAMITAIQNPKLVKKLILLAPAGLESFSDAEAVMMNTATVPSYFENQSEAAIHASFKMNFFEVPADVESLIQYRLQLKRCPLFKSYTQTVSSGVKGMLQHPVKNDLKNIKIPALLLFGENDALIPNKLFHPSLSQRDLVKDAQAAIPNLKTLIISNAGHLLQYEKPLEVSNAIRKFLLNLL